MISLINKNKTLKANNYNDKKENSITSILVVILYFIWPYFSKFITSFISNDMIGKIVSVLLNLLLVMYLVYIYKDTFKNDFKKLKENPKGLFKKLIISLPLMIISVIIVNLIVMNLFNINTISENDQVLYQMFKQTPLLVFILTVLYYPVLEGIVFRKTFKDIINSKWLFIIITSLVYFFFNIAYTSLSIENILSSLYYIVIMFYLSKIYYETDNLVLSIILLMLYNSFVFLV